MSTNKPDSLFYKTLVTEAWTSHMVMVLILGLGLSIFTCAFFGLNTTSGQIITLIATVLAFPLATAYVIGLKHPAIRVYKTGEEYKPEKIITKIGARKPSQREMNILKPILERVAQQEPRARGFSNIYVLDSHNPYLSTIGNTIFITAPTFDIPYLGALIAHELGHIQNQDGTVMMALRILFQINFFNRNSLENPFEFSTSMMIGTGADYDQVVQSMDPVGLLRGKDMATGLMILGAKNFVGSSGFGVRAHMKSWAAYFREQDYLADDFAVKCGYKEQLAEFLEQFRLIYASDELAWQAPPELRLDRIRTAN